MTAKLAATEKQLGWIATNYPKITVYLNTCNSEIQFETITCLKLCLQLHINSEIGDTQDNVPPTAFVLNTDSLALAVVHG